MEEESVLPFPTHPAFLRDVLGSPMANSSHVTSPSLRSVKTTSTTSTKKSNDSNATVTQAIYDKKVASSTDLPSNNDDKSRNNLEESLDQPRYAKHDREPHQATVGDDASVSESERNAPSASETGSLSPNATSGVSSSEVLATPSSRSTLPSLVANQHSSQTAHGQEAQGRTDDGDGPMAGDGKVPRAEPLHLHHLGKAFVTGDDAHAEQEHPTHYAAWNMDQQMRDTKDQEEAYYNHFARAQYHHYYQDVPYTLPNANAAEHHQYGYYPQMTVEHAAAALPHNNQAVHTAVPPVSGRASIPIAPEAPDPSRKTLVGYELLASKLAEASPDIRPAYRKFEALQHRVLLHIQDEISELEERLRRLDEVIAQSTTSDRGEGSPLASRRTEAYYGNALHADRTQLLGQVFWKMEQYRESGQSFAGRHPCSVFEKLPELTCCVDRTLSAYSSVTTNLERASGTDVARYREWMSKHRPVHHIEARFLLGSEDLVTFPQRATGGSIAPRQSAAVLLVFLPFLPLGTVSDHARKTLSNGHCVDMSAVTFSLVPTFSGRIFITAAIVAAGWLYVSGTESRLCLTDRYWALAILM